MFNCIGRYFHAYRRAPSCREVVRASQLARSGDEMRSRNTFASRPGGCRRGTAAPQPAEISFFVEFRELTLILMGDVTTIPCHRKAVVRDVPARLQPIRLRQPPHPLPCAAGGFQPVLMAFPMLRSRDGPAKVQAVILPVPSAVG